MESNEKPTPLWKKEISFRRKPAENASEPVAAPDAEQPATTPAPRSVWKKEVSLRKKAKAAEPEQVELSPPAEEPLPDFELALEAFRLELEPELEAEPVPEPVQEIEHSWLTKPLEEVSEPPESQPEPESVVPEIEALDPAVVGELLAEVAEAAAEAELPAAELELPSLADCDLPEFADLLDLPDLPAAVVAEPVEDAPAADAVAKVPFYKRDLSSLRGSRERKPKTERPRREHAPKPDAAGKTPFYKRDLSLKRGSKQWDAAEPPSEPKRKAAPNAKPKRVARPKLRRAPLPKPSFPTAKGGKKLVGLKIGASQIAAARIVNGSEPELVQVAREPLEPGIVVGGELRDPEALAVALKEFFRKHKLPKRGVRLGIANNRIGVRTFEVSGIDDPKQLANAIRFRAQEVLPIPIEEAVLDYQILSESTDQDGVLTRRVLLVVAYRELVDRYVQACHKAGIEIIGIDLEAFALLRALAEPRTPVPGDDRGALVAVSVGHDRSTFAVSDGRNCEFTRVLEWGGWALNVAIARALDLSPSEAEPVKRALSFTGTEELPAGFDESQLESAREAARKQLQSFARELVSSLQFYQNQPDSLGIGEIVLTGGTTHLPGFAAELQRLIGVPVRVGDPLARVKVSKRIRESEQAGSFAIAIGLGIED